MRQFAAWGFLLVVAIFFLVAGFRGRPGSILAALLAPASLQDTTQG